MSFEPGFSVTHAITADLTWTRGDAWRIRGDAAAVPEAPRSKAVAARRARDGMPADICGSIYVRYASGDHLSAGRPD